MKRLFVYILIGLMCFGVCACSYSRNRSAQDKRAIQIAKTMQAMAQGAELGSLLVQDARFLERRPNPNAYLGTLLYSNYCDVCHKSASKAPKIVGTRIPDQLKSDYYILEYGYSSGKYAEPMPAFRTRLTNFQLLDVLAGLGHDQKLLEILSEEVKGNSQIMQTNVPSRAASTSNTAEKR